jgi:NAD(P)-dependent dehydrogenase (short-subunit alcohol dehydrogenase family)
LEFASHGAKIAIADLNLDGARRVTRELEQGDHEALAVEVDVTHPSQVGQAVQRILEHFGTIHILVNCAGWNRLRPVQEYTLEEWEKIRALNLDGPWHMSKAVIPTLIKNRRGKIVNISSGSGILAQPNMAAYGAAKHGLVGLTKTLAVDLAPYHVNVNCICPATVDTPLVREATTQAYRDHAIQRIPLGRLGRVADIAKAALFLVSSDADWITGVILPVDGGLTCCSIAHPVE